MSSLFFAICVLLLLVKVVTSQCGSSSSELYSTAIVNAGATSQIMGLNCASINQFAISRFYDVWSTDGSTFTMKLLLNTSQYYQPSSTPNTCFSSVGLTTNYPSKPFIFNPAVTEHLYSGSMFLSLTCHNTGNSPCHIAYSVSLECTPFPPISTTTICPISTYNPACAYSESIFTYNSNGITNSYCCGNGNSPSFSTSTFSCSCGSFVPLQLDVTSSSPQTTRSNPYSIPFNVNHNSGNSILAHVLGGSGQFFAVAPTLNIVQVVPPLPNGLTLTQIIAIGPGTPSETVNFALSGTPLVASSSQPYSLLIGDWEYPNVYVNFTFYLSVYIPCGSLQSACDSNAICISQTCVCNSGFQGNGKICVASVPISSSAGNAGPFAIESSSASFVSSSSSTLFSIGVIITIVIGGVLVILLFVGFAFYFLHGKTVSVPTTMVVQVV